LAQDVVAEGRIKLPSMAAVFVLHCTSL